MDQTLIEFIQQHGYLGVAVLMLLENIFPPIPSELIMPFAGFAAARGDLNAIGVVGAGVLGSVLGTLPWYWAGQKLGSERLRQWARRHGRWMTVSPDELDRAQAWFDRHGPLSVMAGRLIPAVRSVISVPAGVLCMPMPRFLLWTTLGSTVWTLALASIGFVLEAQHEVVQRWLSPVTHGILACIVVAYLYRVTTFGRRGDTRT